MYANNPNYFIMLSTFLKEIVSHLPNHQELRILVIEQIASKYLAFIKRKQIVDIQVIKISLKILKDQIEQLTSNIALLTKGEKAFLSLLKGTPSE